VRRMKYWKPVFAQFDLRHCTITIKDGGANSLEVRIGEGNLTYDETRAIKYTLDRGHIYDVRQGDDVPVDVKLDFMWEYLRGTPASASTPSVEEALKNIGNASTWVSSDSDACRPYAVDIVCTYNPVPTSCGDQEVITLADFRYEKLNHDMKAGSVGITGKCNIAGASVIRSANVST